MKINSYKKSKRLRLIVAAVMVMETLLPFIALPAHAAGVLTSTYLRLNRMKSGTATTMRLVFTTSGTAGSPTSLLIDMNGVIDTGTAQWTNATPGGLVNATQTAVGATGGTCAAETGTTGLPGTLSASGSGSVITISSITALANSTSYCVDLTNASSVTTPTAGHEGEYHPSITTKTGATVDDTVNIAVRVIAADQVSISAVVPPIFTFVLGGTTDSFATNLAIANTVSTSGDQVTITTNAASGWVVWVKGTNSSTTGTANYGALKSPSAANYTIPSNATGTLGAAAHTNSNAAEDYGLAVDSVTDAAGGGTVTPDAAYTSTGGFSTCSGNGTCKLGGIDTSIYRPIASASGTASGSGDVVHFVERANITGATPAATDYADTLTVIGAGKF